MYVSLNYLLLPKLKIANCTNAINFSVKSHAILNLVSVCVTIFFLELFARRLDGDVLTCAFRNPRIWNLVFFDCNVAKCSQSLRGRVVFNLFHS